MDVIEMGLYIFEETRHKKSPSRF